MPEKPILQLILALTLEKADSGSSLYSWSLVFPPPSFSAPPHLLWKKKQNQKNNKNQQTKTPTQP